MTCRYFMQWFTTFKCFESELRKCRVNLNAILERRDIIENNEHHHHHHHDLLERSKLEERIKNKDKEVSSSSEYRREFEDARVIA
jgi:ABC-type lipopolysaccharide export system ATPase subunit